MKDYLEASGVTLEQITPKEVIKQAFAAKLISDGQIWVEILDCRNRMSRTYDEAAFNEAVHQIAKRFLKAFQELYELFKNSL